jgi:hypothetical protein
LMRFRTASCETPSRAAACATVRRSIAKSCTRPPVSGLLIASTNDPTGQGVPARRCTKSVREAPSPFRGPERHAPKRVEGERMLVVKIVRTAVRCRWQNVGADAQHLDGVRSVVAASTVYRLLPSVQDVPISRSHKNNHRSRQGRLHPPYGLSLRLLGSC